MPASWTLAPHPKKGRASPALRCGLSQHRERAEYRGEAIRWPECVFVLIAPSRPVGHVPKAAIHPRTNSVHQHAAFDFTSIDSLESVASRRRSMSASLLPGANGHTVRVLALPCGAPHTISPAHEHTLLPSRHKEDWRNVLSQWRTDRRATPNRSHCTPPDEARWAAARRRESVPHCREAEARRVEATGARGR